MLSLSRNGGLLREVSDTRKQERRTHEDAARKREDAQCDRDAQNRVHEQLHMHAVGRERVSTAIATMAAADYEQAVSMAEKKVSRGGPRVVQAEAAGEPKPTDGEAMQKLQDSVKETDEQEAAKKESE